MCVNNLIQIAGVIDQAEAEMLQHCGVKYLGFPLRLPVHQPDLAEEDASRLIRRLKPPVFGVLTPDDVRNAIVAVKPAGVDVHTGVEDASGRKSRAKVEKFIARAEAGFRMLRDQIG